MSELWGIDDPQEKQLVERTINSRSRSLIRVFLYLGSSGFLAAVVGRFLIPYSPIFGSTAAVIVFLLGVAICFANEFSRYLREKTEVLREQGRCVNCGYKLDEAAESRCPECGLFKDTGSS